MPDRIVLQNASALRMSDVVKFYCDISGQAYQAPSSDGPYAGIARAAFAEGEIVGLMSGRPLADNDGSGRQLLFLHGVIRPDWRKRGIGGRLLDGIVEECRSLRYSTTILASVPEDADPSIARFLQRHGFARRVDILRFERELPDVPGAEQDTTLSVALYRGGEPATDEAIVDLYHRAYRSRHDIPRLTPEKVRERLAFPGSAYLLASDAGRLVGHAAVFWEAAEYFVDSVLVARSYWGSAAADILVRAMFRHASKVGCRRIAGTVDETNAASCDLCRRHGLTVADRTHRFAVEVQPR